MNNNNMLGLAAILFCCILTYYNFKSTQEIQKLQERIEVLTARLSEYDSDSSEPESIEKKKEVTPKTEIQSGGFEKVFKQMVVSSSYRIEDRYVSYKVHKPDMLGNKEGCVVVNILVDRFGEVTKTSVNKASTITDEDVIDSARKAALQTDFNYKSDAPDKQSGIITYTYKIQ